jgi:hypothetical protein
MRGGRLFTSGIIFLLAACSGPALSDPPRPAPADLPPLEPRPRLLSDDPPRPAGAPPPEILEEPPQGSIKGADAAVVPVRAETAPIRDPRFDEVLRLQKEISARNPASEEEKVRLAFLLASAGQVEEAEAVLATARTRADKLHPYLLFYLRKELGDHQEASKLLIDFVDADRRATGFIIERAELCSQIRRYRDYTAALTDRVPPGGVVLLYVEPRNFTLKRDQERYILHLEYEWRLYDDRSAEVSVPSWENAPKSEREDRNYYRGPVDEFHQSFRLPLPANLAMGHYRVKVTVRDAHTGQSDRVYVPIYVTPR